MSKFTKTIAGFAGSIALIASLAGSAAAADFHTNLTVGSKGANVTDLQTWLVSKGYLVMPTGVSYGYFGSLTKAAVAAYQTAKGITPAAGYFGPITQAAANADGGGMGAMGGSSVPGCSAGAMYSSTTGAPCVGASMVPGCSAGAMYSSTTGAPCTGGAPAGSTTVADGKDGSLSVSYDPYAPSSQTLKKGDTNKAAIAVKLSASSGNVSVNRLDVEFSDRPWLYFSKLTLKDTAGNTIATKMLNSSADADEITVGSDYKVRFDNVNYLVTPDADKTLVAYLDVLAASDKINNNYVYVGIPTGNIRSINGKGYTDSLGISGSGTGSGVTSSTGVSIYLASTGSTASIYTRISPVTPDSRIVVTNNTSVTTDVVLGVFGIKSTNQSSTLNTLSFNINTGTSTASYATTSLVSNVRLKVGSQVYGANSLAAGASTFTNLNIALPVEQWTDVTLLADINSGYQSNQITASSTLVAASMVGVDGNFNSLTLSSASNATSNNITFLQAGLSLSGPVATLGSAISGPLAGGTTSGTVGYNTHYEFTLTNTGNTDVYVPKAPGIFLGTTTVIGGVGTGASASSTITNLTIGGNTLAGDTSIAYVIPAGNSRLFKFDGVLKGGAGGGLSSQTIVSVNFNATAANVTATSTAGSNAITFGLNALTLNAGF